MKYLKKKYCHIWNI